MADKGQGTRARKLKFCYPAPCSWTRSCYFERAHYPLTCFVSKLYIPPHLYFAVIDIDYGQPWRRSFGDAVTYTDWQRDSYLHAVEKLVGNRSKIGLEFDHISLVNYGKVKNALPKTEMVDVGNATMQMRMMKSAEEIALIKNGARIADIGGHACHSAIAENVPEYEVAMVSTQTMIREIAATYPHVELMDSMAFLV